MNSLSRRNTGLPRRAFPAWSPFSLMDDLLRAEGFDSEATPSRFSARFDIKETEQSYELHADLPGIKQEDLDITLREGVLTISGKREEEKKSEGERWHSVERSFGKFARSFQLPEGVTEDDVSAELKNGVLTVSVKKPGEVKPKTIPVKS